LLLQYIEMRFMFVMESFLHNIFTIFIFKRCHYSMYMFLMIYFYFYFLIVVVSMDAHAYIKREMHRLRHSSINYYCYDRHHMHGSNLDTTIETFSRSNGVLQDIATFHTQKINDASQVAHLFSR